MKCQHCDRDARVHITEITEDHEPQEVHLCEPCAEAYLNKSNAIEEEPSASLAGNLVHHLKISETATDLARLDQQTCPDCGISFYEFRNSGRLGCPHDYDCFEQDLTPLIQSIPRRHGTQGQAPQAPTAHGLAAGGLDPAPTTDGRVCASGRLRRRH